MYLVGENQGLIVVNRGLMGQCGKSNIESLIWDIDCTICIDHAVSTTL